MVVVYSSWKAKPSMDRIDIVSAAFHANPAEIIDRLTAVPVVQTRLPIVGKINLLTTHDTCSAFLKGDEAFRRNPADVGKMTQERILKLMPRSIALLALNMLGQDDPEHRRLRGLVDKAFQRRSIEALHPVIASVADGLLDRMDGSRPIDLMDAYCRDLPLSVICVLLGLSDRDHYKFRNWLGGLKDTANIWAVLGAIPGVLKVVNYLRSLAKQESDAKSGGLIAALRDAEIDDRRLTEDEVVSMIFLLFGAGQEATTHLISGGLLEILRDGNIRRQLQEDPDLMPLFVEECLRHVSPVQMTKPRWASRDVVVGGYRFRRGDMAAGFLAAANRDPSKFLNPHHFDMRRRPNPHLSFGTGIHFCLGFQLARAEAAIAFERILVRFPDMHLAIDPSKVAWRRRVGIRALTALPVVLS